MASWQGWHEIPGGGRTFSGPAVGGGLDVFVRGTDDQIHHNRFLSGSSWEGWRPVSGLTTQSAPATTVVGGNVYVFARRTDGHIFSNRWNGVAGEGWQEVPGGELTDSAPAAAAGVLAVRRADGGIRFNTFDGGPVLSWRGWGDVPDEGRTPSAPALTDFSTGFFLFVRGTDDDIHYKSLAANRVTWGAWQRVQGGGRTPSAPAIARGLLVVRGTDDQLHQNGFTGGSDWEGWRVVPGGGLTQDAPALAHTPGFFALVVRGTDNGIHVNLLA